jgi:hypothetical protein
VTLVDYDGLYVPEFDGGEAPELGLPNYQHPRRTAAQYGPGVDRFPLLVLCTGLYALAADPALWERFNPVDTESFLFTRDDFLYPEDSALVASVRECGDARAALWLGRLLAASAEAPEATPLPDVADEHDAAAAPPSGAAPARALPWWIALQHASDPAPVLEPRPSLPPIPSDTARHAPPSFAEVSTDWVAPSGGIAAAAAVLAASIFLATGWLMPGTVFILLIIGAFVTMARWRAVTQAYPHVKIMAAVVFVLFVATVVPVHLVVALAVTTGSLLADRYAKWKKGTASRCGRLTARFADVASTLQGLDAQRGAVEGEILTLNRAEVNEKNSSLLYLRRKAADAGLALPTMLPPDLDRAITMRYAVARGAHADTLAGLTRSIAGLQAEQQLIVEELDTLQPPTFMDYLTSKAGTRT